MPYIQLNESDMKNIALKTQLKDELIPDKDFIYMWAASCKQTSKECANSKY